MHALNPRQMCNTMYSLLFDMCQNAEQRQELEWELTAPLDPMERLDREWARRPV